VVAEFSDFPSGPNYIAGFCEGASLTWKSGHFMEEIILAGRGELALADVGHPLPEIFLTDVAFG